MEAVRKGKVKGGKAGDWPMWVEEMRKHDVPEWYIESLAKIGYLFPKAHAVAYVMMAFRIAWFKVHEPLAFYATFFSIRAKAFDAEFCCAGKEAVEAGERDAAALKALMGGIIEAEPLARIDYVEVVDGVTMQPTDVIGAVALVAMAVYIGSTRLIDNFIFEEGN